MENGPVIIDLPFESGDFPRSQGSQVLHATRASSAARLTLSHHPQIAKKTGNIWDNYGTIMGQLSQAFRHGHLHIISLYIYIPSGYLT